jgi:hypothetical protein
MFTINQKSQPAGFSIVQHNGMIIAQLYDTKLVVINEADGTAILNSGGWKTAHTKKCMNIVMNQFGVNVKAVKGQWVVTARGVTESFGDGLVVKIGA